MRGFFTRMVKLAALALLMCITSCAGVTETGNPRPAAAGEPLVQPDGARVYTNEAFRIQILIPSTWTFEEDASESLTDVIIIDLISEDHDDGTTAVTVSLEILEPRPLSLFAYLFEEYPERKFTVYLTPTLVGYLYDDPLPGPDGGDLREYFFLNEDVLVHVDGEVFPSTTTEFLSLLEGITFF